MNHARASMLDRTASVYVAALCSLLLGLFFTFVWAPHPWGWQGIDQYHQLASALARGETFATTDVPWGYAYFAACFYWLFGERVWLPVTAQVFLNAFAPIVLYRIVRPLTSQRVAVLASLITGVFSFNNVYASTQASDALCTVLFLLALFMLTRAMATGRLGLFAAAGLLAGVVPQFRPNLVLLPALFAVGYALYHRSIRHFVHMAVFSICVVAPLMPWIFRNYQLTGLFLPTSTHGGVQLWYGSLQVGPFLESRADNPRSIFESPSFHYTSLAGTPIEIEAREPRCSAWRQAAFTLHYWTDRDATVRTAAPRVKADDHLVFDVPGQATPTVVYYYFSARWDDGDAAHEQDTPLAGAATPFVYFVSDDHLGDLDRHGDLVDVFDLIRTVTVDGASVDPAIQDLARKLLPDPAPPSPVASIVRADRNVRVIFADESTWDIPLPVPRRLTDIEVRGTLAGALLSARRQTRAADQVRTSGPNCQLSDQPAVNAAFYRREPHMMRRYLALAADNINRDRLGFAAASAYRAVRLFIIRGTSDVHVAQQFSASGVAYTAGTILSATYFLVFLTGAWVAWRQRSALLWLLVPIVYVPLTICFVLTNMRYTVTMQPLMFVFVALAVVTVLRLDPPGGGRGTGEAAGASR